MSNPFAAIAHAIANFFSSHKDAIHSATAVGQTAATYAAIVLGASGQDKEGKISGTILNISKALGEVSKTASDEASATTLSEHANNLTNLALKLTVDTNLVGVKSAASKAAIADVAHRVVSVVDALQAAHDSQTGGQVGTDKPTPILVTDLPTEKHPQA